MSNRPVRLKYLKPKMKIILCIFLLYITALSVFGKPQELNGILGESVKFPAAVKKVGSLMHSSVTLGDVTSGSFTALPNEKFSSRLQWDSSTGLFSLSGLKMEDSGEYKVHNTDQNINTVFQLNVYKDNAVTVFGILGQSVKFPAAVKKGGFLMYSGVTIIDSSLGTPRNENYRDRLQWDSSTGLFSLSGLKMEDSGEYEVRNTDQNITVFQLNVYKDNVPVSKPHVSITHNEYPCTIECTAERGTEVTLSWYREGEKKSFASSRVASAPHLHLPHSVESGTYTCEAKNSVSRETSDPLTMGAHCTDSSTIVAIIIAAAVVVVVLIAVSSVVLYCYMRRHQAVRTLIQVKELIDNVDLHGYDEPDPPDAVRTLIEVKEMLDNLDPRACGVRTLRRGVRTLRRVKEKLDNLDPCAFVKIFFDNVDLHKNVVRPLIQVKMLLDIVDLHAYGMFIYHPEATEKITSSHETEVPLKQVTCEVGEP